MTDRVYPSSKPPTTNATNPPQTLNGTTTATTNPPPFSTTKPQPYNPTRHPYRPQPRHHRRSRRSCTCCCCCFWSILIILLLALVAATACAALWVLYRPHRPTFSVSTLKISHLNLTTADDSSSSHLTTTLNLTLSAQNPNKKLTFFYDPATISVLSNNVLVANGSFPLFTSHAKNTTIMRSTLSTSQDLDTESVTTLRSDLKKKSGLPLKVQLDTKVRVKMDGLKTKKVGIRVTCDGIHGVAPKGKSPSVASTSDAKCKVDLRIKIWKWTF